MSLNDDAHQLNCCLCVRIIREQNNRKRASESASEQASAGVLAMQRPAAKDRLGSRWRDLCRCSVAAELVVRVQVSFCTIIRFDFFAELGPEGQKTVVPIRGCVQLLENAIRRPPLSKLTQTASNTDTDATHRSSSSRSIQGGANREQIRAVARAHSDQVLAQGSAALLFLRLQTPPR